MPVYNGPGLEAVLTTLRPHIHAGDIFLVISGNTQPINLDWMNATASTLKEQFPQTTIAAGTSGLGNMAAAAEGVQAPIVALTYIYEPNFPNEPEFTWDFQDTLSHFDQVAGQARAHGLRVIGKPTGRPILQGALQQYGWDYATLGARVDELFIQTQTYCKDGTDTFKKAISKVADQYSQIGSSQPWFAEITVDPAATNGVSVSQAVECASVVRDATLTGVLMWWSPPSTDEAVQFLTLLGR